MTTPIDEELLTATRLLNDSDWEADGYTDKFEWLREMYGHYPDSVLIQMFTEDMEGFL